MEDADDGIGRAVFDCLSAVLLLLTALLGAYLPRYLSSRGGEQSGTATSLAFHLGNMLSGGVMLSAGFCHLLADSLRQLAFIGRFPISTFLAAVGYLITLLADQMVQVLTADRPSAAAAAGDPGSSSNLRQHKYTRLGDIEDSASAIEMFKTQQTVCEQRELNGGTTGDGRMHQHNIGWGSSCSQGELCGFETAAAVGSTGNLPRLSLPTSITHTTSHANGLPTAHGSRTADGDDDDSEALCVFASGSPRAITADTTTARPCSRSACTATAAATASQHPAADHRLEMQAIDARSSTGSGGGRGCKVADHLSQQEQQEHEQIGNGAPADVRLPCSQLLVSSPRRQQRQRQSMRLPHQQQQGVKFSPESEHNNSNCNRWSDVAVVGTSSPNGGHGAIQQLDWPDAGVRPSSQCEHQQQQPQPQQPQHQQQQQQHVRHLNGGACCQHPEDMTEACTVARVAGHLELEIQHAGHGQPGAAHTHAHFQVLLSHQPLSFATTVLLACALCIHSILEGIALGAQQSMEATRDIMLAIAAHKGLAAYALGASIVESKASTAKFWTVVSMFAVATPIGIGIGYAFSNIGHGSVSAAMSALASGTFLYVALNEVIPKELEHPDGHRVLKVAALLLGFGLMSLLAVWA